MLRLAAFFVGKPGDARYVAAKLRLSNADREQLATAAIADVRICAGLAPRDARKLIYGFGAECFRDQLLLRWAASHEPANDPNWLRTHHAR